MKAVIKWVVSSINSKLIAPMVISFMLAVGGFYFVVEYSAKALVHEKLQNRAYELAESFVVATGVNTSRANFIRVINSIGAYDDIKLLFLLDDSNDMIIASSHNRYTGKGISSIEDVELHKNLITAINSRQDYFWDDHLGEHYFAYKTQIITPDQPSLLNMTLFMKVDTSSSEQYIYDINFFFFSTLLAVLSILTVMQFIFVRRIILRPIFKLVDSIKQTKLRSRPVVSEYQSNDQLGTLTRVYNELITDSFKKQQELAEEREKSIAASKAKSQFLAMMTHELRTPLNGVIGMSNKLDEKITDPAYCDYIKVIQTSANQLLNIVNDTLDFSKIEANKLVLDIQPFDIYEALNSVINMFQMQVDRKNVELVFNHPSDSLPLVMGDHVRLIQVMINLIGNAIKYTEQGRITVSLEINSKIDEQIEFSFRVSDSGIGMSEEQIQLLFREFSQADSSTTRKYGGTGLGLWISKNLIEKMNGSIDIDSQLGKGTIFTVYVTLPISTENNESSVQPIQATVTETSEEIDINKLPHIDIMLVEDTEINRMVVMAILDYDNITFHIAENGQQALTLFESCDCDLILMDCLMPVMDGFTAARKIREIEKQRSEQQDNDSHIPIIALTANALENTKQECIDSGMDEFLTKPIIPELLRKSVTHWVKNKAD